MIRKTGHFDIHVSIVPAPCGAARWYVEGRVFFSEEKKQKTFIPDRGKIPAMASIVERAEK